MSTCALVILASGFEEIEAITVIDMLRRAEFDVTVAGTTEGPITASRGTRHLADIELLEAIDKDYDIIILPGGLGGRDVLRENANVLALLRAQQVADRWIAAICAAPTVLLAAEVLKPEHKITCHPGNRSEVPAEQLDMERRVVVSNKLITSIAAGSSMEFAYAIIEELLGLDAVHAVDKGLYAPAGVAPSR